MKDTNKNIKFQDETLELFLKTMTKIMQKVAKEELKNFEKHYTEDVLAPTLEAMKTDLEKQITELKEKINDLTT